MECQDPYGLSTFLIFLQKGDGFILILTPSMWRLGVQTQKRGLKGNLVQKNFFSNRVDVAWQMIEPIFKTQATIKTNKKFHFQTEFSVAFMI